LPSINNGDRDRTEVGAVAPVFSVGTEGIRVFGFATGTLVGDNDDDMLREGPVLELTGVFDSLNLREGKRSFGIAPPDTQTGDGYGRSEDINRV